MLYILQMRKGPDERVWILSGCTQVALSPPGLTAGSSISSYVIHGYTTPSYCEPVTLTTSGNPHLITPTHRRTVGWKADSGGKPDIFVNWSFLLLVDRCFITLWWQNCDDNIRQSTAHSDVLKRSNEQVKRAHKYSQNWHKVGQAKQHLTNLITY